MIVTEDKCFGSCGCDCDSRCSNYGQKRTYLKCDECGSIEDVLFEVGDLQVCRECLEEMFPTITEDDLR